MDEYGTNLKEYMLLSHNIHVISYNIYIYIHIIIWYFVVGTFSCFSRVGLRTSVQGHLGTASLALWLAPSRAGAEECEGLEMPWFPWLFHGFQRDFYGISMGFLWASMGHGSLMRFINTVSKYSWIVLWFHSDNWRLFMEMNGIWKWLEWRYSWFLLISKVSIWFM